VNRSKGAGASGCDPESRLIDVRKHAWLYRGSCSQLCIVSHGRTCEATGLCQGRGEEMQVKCTRTAF